MLELQMNEFKEYFENFDTTNENILRKYTHSIRVMEYSLEIAKSLNLPEIMIEIVGIAGLLHDIGRFEQWKKYETYSDLHSIDHGKLGVEILKHNNYIKKYVFDDNYVNTIYSAVYEHNKYKISNNLSFNEEIVCKIIKDADKLDILETQCNSVKSNVILHQEILENIYKKQLCINRKENNEADNVIKQICFIYDINFQYSLQYIKDKNIINNKLELIKNHTSENVNFSKIKIYLNDYLNSRINS